MVSKYYASCINCYFPKTIIIISKRIPPMQKKESRSVKCLDNLLWGIDKHFSDACCLSSRILLQTLEMFLNEKQCLKHFTVKCYIANKTHWVVPIKGGLYYSWLYRSDHSFVVTDDTWQSEGHNSWSHQPIRCCLRKCPVILLFVMWWKETAHLWNTQAFSNYAQVDLT